MKLLEGLQNQISHYIKGTQFFDKSELLRVIKEHNIVFANNVMIDEDEQGEHLILTFDDQMVCFELIWRQEGPRHTLIELRLA